MSKAAAFPKPSSQRAEPMDTTGDHDDLDDQDWGDWKPTEPEPTQEEKEERFAEAQDYENYGRNRVQSSQSEWPPYVDTTNTPWRIQEASADKIPPSQAPETEHVDPGQARSLSPRGSIGISMDRKRQAEEETPWRKPRHHVYGYRQRDPDAEAEILHELDGFERWSNWSED